MPVGGAELTYLHKTVGNEKERGLGADINSR